MNPADSEYEVLSLALKRLRTGQPGKRLSNGDLAKAINSNVALTNTRKVGESVPNVRDLTGNDISKLLVENQLSLTVLKRVAVYFDCLYANEILPEVDAVLVPNAKSGSQFEHAGAVRSALDQLIRHRMSRATKSERETVYSSTIAKDVLSFIYNLRDNLDDHAGVATIPGLLKSGRPEVLKNIIANCQKLSPDDTCELAKSLTLRVFGADNPPVNAVLQKAEVDFAESKNFERRRSRLAKLIWPKPYRNQWWYLENTIKQLSEFPGQFEEFFAGYAKVGIENHIGQVPPELDTMPYDAENYAFIFDPNFKDFKQFEVEGLEPENLPNWVPPARMYRPIYLSLVRAIRRRELLEDKMYIGIEAGLTSYNKMIRIRKFRFSAIVGTHYTAGVSIFSKAGDRIFDGLSHVSEEGNWKLMRSHNCPNVLRVSSIVVTSDHHLIVQFGPINSFFPEKTWLPLAAGHVSLDDYRSACDSRPDKDKTSFSISHLAQQTTLRKLKDSFKISPEEVETETVGIAFDVLHGRIPTIFQVTRLKRSKAEIMETLGTTDAVCRVLDLIQDSPSSSYMELLESASFHDAELLKANMFFALRSETVKNIRKSRSRKIIFKSKVKAKPKVPSKTMEGTLKNA